MLNCQSDFLFVGQDVEAQLWDTQFPNEVSSSNAKDEPEQDSPKIAFFPHT